jgi:hypothetical protein
MSAHPADATSVTSHYVAQVTEDLERNAKEQERIGHEIAALQEQLSTLQSDHDVLQNVQMALGVDAVRAPTQAAAASPAVPQQASGTEAKPARRPAARTADTRRSAGQSKNSAGKKTGAAAASPAGTASQPTLVELIRIHLNQYSEPRSAAEIASALTGQHPDRSIKTTVVRTTLENLVARSQAHRSKQGASVFYASTAPQPEATTASAPAGPEAEKASLAAPESADASR